MISSCSSWGALRSSSSENPKKYKWLLNTLYALQRKDIAYKSFSIFNVSMLVHETTISMATRQIYLWVHLLIEC
jgi:hypothetical protein